VSHVILDLVEAQSGIALAFEQTDEAALLEAARAQRANAAARRVNALMKIGVPHWHVSDQIEEPAGQAILKAMADATSKQQEN
jgi:hypothetical protein